MRRNALIPVAALCVGLSMATAVPAQTVVGGMTVPPDELPEVQARCLDLEVASRAESIATTDPKGETDEADFGATTDVPEAEEVEDATTSVNLDAITLQDCVEAGLAEDIP